MKLYTLFIYVLAALLLMVSCKDGNSFGDEYFPESSLTNSTLTNSTDSIEVKTGITETSSTLSLSMSVGVYTDVITATFDSNDVCIKWVEMIIFPSKDIANQTWDALMAELDDEEKARYSKDGKTITIDMTEEFKGATRAQVRQVFESMMANTGV